MEKYKIETKKVKMIITIFDPTHYDDEDFEEIEMDILMPKGQWDTFIATGEFDVFYGDIIEAYKKWIESVKKYECYITFAEIEADINK